MKPVFLLFLFSFFCLLIPTFAQAQCNPAAADIPNNGIDEDCDGLDGIFLCLPPYIYMVEGQEFELYFRNLILSKHPQDYVFSINTALNGVNSGQKWTCTPTANNTGEFPLSVTVRTNSGQTLASASSTIRISPVAAPPNMSPKRLVLFGHSFYDQGYLPKYIYDRTHQPGNPPISFHGKRTSWANDLARHEGHGGRQGRWFFEDWESPVRYGPTVNLRRYFDDVIGPGGRPDWVIFHLDINDFCGNSSLVGNSLQEIDDYVLNYWNQYRLVDSIRAASPNTKIAICLSPMPNARDGAFDINFGGNPVLNNRWRWQKIISRLLFKNIERYGNREAENIFLLPEHLDLDDFVDYTPLDAIHPDPPDNNIDTHCGYMEIAKSIYAWIRWAEFHPAPPSSAMYPYFRDADGDGYGHSGQTQMATTAPAGYTSQAGDCNDNNPNIHPNAAEICGNNVDDDCDGTADQDLTPPVAGCRTTVQLALSASGTALLNIAQVNLGSYDACSAVTFSLSRSQFSCADLGPNTVRLRMQDAAGNANFCESNVYIVDNLAPVIQCPGTSLDLGPTGQVLASLNTLGLQAQDNCSATTWQTSASLHFTCQQANTTVALPLTARDNAGNTASCTLQVLVTNTADSDGDGVKNCLDACPNDAATSTLLQFYPDADLDGFGGSSGTPVLACVRPAGTAGNKLDCNDNNPNIHPGAPENCTNNVDDDCDGIIDEDIAAPMANCRSSVLLPLNASGLAVLNTAQVNQNSADGCSALTLSLSRTQFSCANVGANIILLYVKDAAGNMASCSSNVQVVDNLAPVIQCPPTLLDLGPSGQVLASLGTLGLQAVDNCGPSIWQTSTDLHFSCQQANTTVALPLTAQDISGNTATCTLQIYITNTADADADGVTNCLDACPNNASASTLLQFFPDTDQDGFGSSSSDAVFACTKPSGTAGNNLDCDDNNPNIHPGAPENCTNQVDDDCDGVIDEDFIAPVVICQTTVVLPLDADGVASLQTSQVDQSSFDGCSALTFSLSRSQFSCADLGLNTVTLHLQDAAGNPGACATTVEVVDTSAPVIHCPSGSLDLGPSGQVVVSLENLGLQALDNCGPTTWETTADLHFTCQQANTTVGLALTAQDNAGNKSACTLQLFVTDTTDTDADGANNCLDACPNDPTTEILFQFFPDADLDGFGSGDAAYACVPPAGSSSNSLDCDDTKPNIHPNALEIPDGLDNDCNGQIDDVVVGAGNLAANQTLLRLFPNPAHDQLRVECLAPANQPPYRAWIIEPTGRVVHTFEAGQFSRGILEIDVSGLAAGVYWVKVWLADGNAGVGRFLKI